MWGGISSAFLVFAMAAIGHERRHDMEYTHQEGTRLGSLGGHGPGSRNASSASIGSVEEGSWDDNISISGEALLGSSIRQTGTPLSHRALFLRVFGPSSYLRQFQAVSTSYFTCFERGNMHIALACVGLYGVLRDSICSLRLAFGYHKKAQSCSS